MFNHSDLNDVRFQMNSSFVDADFVAVDATKFAANQIGFIAADFTDAKFADSQFNKSRFTGSNLASVEFTNTDMLAADFYLAEDFNGSASLLTANITGCVIGHKAIASNAVDFGGCEVKDISEADEVIANSESQQTKVTTPVATQASTAIPQEVFDRIAAVKASGADKIDLYGFGLTQLPSELLALSQLKVIHLGKNQLDHNQLRLLIKAMPKLDRLYFSSNKLEEIPNEITELQYLSVLNISNNPLGGERKALAQIDKLSTMKQLKKLYLYDLKIDSLPKSFSQLVNLETLSIGKNNFKEVPEVIWQLTTLKVIYVAENKLRILSADIGNLTKLDRLYVDENQLTALPRELAGLPITGFDARNNLLPSGLQKSLDNVGLIGQFDILRKWFADNPKSAGE